MVDDTRIKQMFTEEADTKMVVCIHGQKGQGKTALSFGFPGKKYVLSFDRKSKRIKEYMYNNSNKIVIVDIIKFLTSQKDNYLESCVKTYECTEMAIEEIGNRGDADWIIFDGLEVLIEMSEMKMRFDNQLLPFQGIANLSVWKDRKLNIRNIHEKAFQRVKKGIVYTTYTAKDEIVEEGQIIAKRNIPSYIDIIMYQVDVVMESYIEFTKNKEATYKVHIKTSKIPIFKTGDVFDMTNKTINEVFFTKVPTKNNSSSKEASKENENKLIEELF